MGFKKISLFRRAARSLLFRFSENRLQAEAWKQLPPEKRALIPESGWQSARAYVHESLVLYPHIAAFARKDVYFLQALFFHQYKAGNKSRKFNPKVRSATHALRVTESLLGYFRKTFGRAPGYRLAASCLFHDMVEDDNTSPSEIKTFSGDGVRGAVQELTLSRSTYAQGTSGRQRSAQKHLSKMAKADDYSFIACAVRLFDGIDNVDALARQISQGLVRLTDTQAPASGNGVHLVSRREIQRKLSHRIEFHEAVIERMKSFGGASPEETGGFDVERIIKDCDACFKETCRKLIKAGQLQLPHALNEDLTKRVGGEKRMSWGLVRPLLSFARQRLSLPQAEL